MSGRVTVATCSLAGCFGCHMSFLDLDERLVPLLERVAFDRSPLTDVKHCSERVDIGLVEGGLCNEENVHTLLEFRKSCRILVAVGACAINGGVPALRNRIGLQECLDTAYCHGVNAVNREIPSDPELPLLLAEVRPITDLVAVDHFLPGCPPPADAFLELVTALLEGRQPVLPPSLRRFD
ncbi:MAG: hypothetical protein U0230_17415 [Polyangiales bacterium]